MKTFSEIFKNSFLDNYNSSISLKEIAITLIVAFCFTILIYFIYKITCDKTIYSKKFNTAMSLMTLVVTGIIMAMQANVIVSLGMVGALSIVRYRTAIKEAKDLVFLFWSTSNGIIIGIGLYPLALMLTIVIAIALILFEAIPASKKPMLLVINSNNIDDEEKIKTILNNNKIKYNVKSRNIHNVNIDLIYELKIKDENNLLKEINEIESITNINLICQES